MDGLVGYKPTLKEGSEDYQCGECDYFSRQRYFVIRHYRKTHFDLQDLLNCKVCGEVMEDTPSLLDHMRCQHVEAYNTSKADVIQMYNPRKLINVCSLLFPRSSR